MKLYFHLSNNPNIKTLIPKIPSIGIEGFEDLKTKRCCFSDSIDGCLSAIMPCNNEILYVYTNKEEIKVKKPFIHQVRDCKETGEVWSLKRTPVTLVAKIKVIKEKNYIDTENYKGKFRVHYYDYDILDLYEKEILNFDNISKISTSYSLNLSDSPISYQSIKDQLLSQKFKCLINSHFLRLELNPTFNNFYDFLTIKPLNTVGYINSITFDDKNTNIILSIMFDKSDIALNNLIPGFNNGSCKIVIRVLDNNKLIGFDILSKGE